MTLKRKKKREPLIRKRSQTPKKSISTKLLVKRALKNGPKWKPSQGNVYLESLNPGDSFSMNGTEGILLESNSSAAKVLVLRSSCVKDESDKNYYLGKQTWASKTEVKKN